MSANPHDAHPREGGPRWKMKALVCFAILLAGAVAVTLIFTTEPTATRTGATRKSAMLVNVTEVEAGTFAPTIVAMGTVRPAKDVVLRPRVSGEIIERADAFTPGGFVEKGDVLLRIDPADFQNRLQQRKSELQQAIAELKIETGRQQNAAREFELLERNLTGMKRELILRQPQLRAARARVESARAAVEQAELDLERTTVTAPFDAHILSRNVNLGSQVSPDEPLGRLVGLNTYWVETEVPLSRLQRLTFPRGPNETGSEVRIRNATAWPEGVYRTGYLYRLIGELEGRTRMARVLVAVDDPMGYRTDAADLPALMIGAYVEARIVSRPLSDVVRLSRDYVREGDTVWVMEDDKLSIREVKIAFQNQEYAFIRDGLDASDRVVTSNLATVVDGAALRVAEASEPAQTADRPASADDESATREAG